METKKPVLSDLLLAEVLPAWSRESVTIAAHTPPFLPGTVLAQGADGTYEPVTAATTGDALCVLIEESPGGAARPGIVIARGAVLARDSLIWPAGATETEITLGETMLNALGIVLRDRL